jgi:hypothetical protein
MIRRAVLMAVNLGVVVLCCDLRANAQATYTLKATPKTVA